MYHAKQDTFGWYVADKDGNSIAEGSEDSVHHIADALCAYEMTIIMPNEDGEPVDPKRQLHPIPITAAKHIADKYGYDQIVVMARRTGNAPNRFGEHVTTYGVNPVHCAVAALVGNKLKAVAEWPDRQDYLMALDLLDDLSEGNFTYRDHDKASARIGALRRVLGKL
jgi:hypothetical protein